MSPAVEWLEPGNGEHLKPLMAFLRAFQKAGHIATLPGGAYAQNIEDGGVGVTRDATGKWTGVVITQLKTRTAALYIVHIARTDSAEPGTAQALFDAARARGQALNARRVTLDVNASNTRARKFYAKQGMKVTKEDEETAWYELPLAVKRTGAPGEIPPRWIAGDSLELDQHLDPDEQFDLIFTCPPYGDLEVYSDDPRDISGMDYENFVAAYREIIARACARLKDDRFAVCVVGEIRAKDGGYRNFVGDTVAAFEAAGLRYYNEAIYLTPAGSLALRAANYFTASRKLGKGHQQALVFAKGKPDLHSPEGVSEAVTLAFAEERKLLEAGKKMLVFAKGDPRAAAQDLGIPDMADPIDEWALDQVESIEGDQ
jgi:hypothetical protein